MIGAATFLVLTVIFTALWALIPRIWIRAALALFMIVIPLAVAAKSGFFWPQLIVVIATMIAVPVLKRRRRHSKQHAGR
jgi:hypothetical protein